MKILGTTKNYYNETYICEVSHHELEKFFNQYYSNKKLGDFKTGDEIDLGTGFDHHTKIINALKETKSFIKSHRDVVRAITDGFLIFPGNEDEGNNEKGNPGN